MSKQLPHTAIQDCAELILRYADLDHTNPEYTRTPVRFENFIETLLCRHTEDKPDMRTFETTNNEMVVCGPIDFYSLCPHHLALVIGHAWVGYVPDGKVLGLSKMPRLVRWMAGSPIKQEDLTVQIAQELEKSLFPTLGSLHAQLPRSNGVAVVMDALHTCMLVRGIRVNSNCRVRTSKVTGCFLDPMKQARAEFFNLIRRDET